MDKRRILKQLLLGTIAGHTAARQLQNGGKTIVHLHFRKSDGTHVYDGEVLTEEQYQAKKKQMDPYGLFKRIVIGGRSKAHEKR